MFLHPKIALVPRFNLCELQISGNSVRVPGPESALLIASTFFVFYRSRSRILIENDETQSEQESIANLGFPCDLLETETGKNF